MPDSHNVFAAKRPPGAPPAVWNAFLKASAWKNWVLSFQFAVIALLLLANIRLAAMEPDIVLVTSEGKSTYVERSVAQEALLGFLEEQKGKPSDLAALQFAKNFLRLAQAVNSSTFEHAWPEALGLMSPALRARFQKSSDAQKLVEVHQALQVRTELSFDELAVKERAAGFIHVHAKVRRTKARLLDGGGAVSDRLASDLVLRVIPRSRERPDGMEVVDWRLKVLTDDGSAAPRAEGVDDAD